MARTAVLANKVLQLFEKHHFLSAQAIIELLDKSGKTYNKTSVYRVLDKLLAENKVCKEFFGEKESKYELRSDHHDHAVCTNCEKILKIPCKTEVHKDIIGFTADHHHTTVYGTCAECQTTR